MKIKIILKRVFNFPFILMIKIYQWVISPYLPSSCRHYPSCSAYSLESFNKHGPIKGFVLSAWRILRCNPWGTFGRDPVPEKFNYEYFKNTLKKEKK